ncbi:MAG: tRNA (5-methylaminomethyl-2-thiouridine)(34)-methyltransferase MnmD [Bacteroidales bacterium]|jgi:tRNA U34 5-methylaminomethyl-2-thiouridine-forming methyltransferase MnmC|nr:tRNA (5-methylaminomethyl-2-thiouridine)(34)-methyltransferase MnmD [Bacteroidales bacterium]
MTHTLIETADGSKTIFIPEINEPYHSVNGAITESEYVFVNRGFVFHKKKDPVIFEVGFGTGLNALLTAINAEKNNRQTMYYTIEKYPISNETVKTLAYGDIISNNASYIYEKIHSCEWEKTIKISPHFYIHKINADLVNFSVNTTTIFDIIYFDAFGPDKQPEMWTPEIFQKIYTNCSPGALFVTYSAKGEIRRQLANIGFEIERLQGPPGKKHMLRGIKKHPATNYLKTMLFL